MSSSPSASVLLDPKVRALTELVLLVALIDGHFSTKEYARLVEEVCKLEPELTADQVNLLLEQLDVPTKPSKSFRDERLLSISGALTESEDRKRAMHAAIQVARVDSGIGRRESAFLVRAAEILELDAESALALLKA